MGVSSSLLELAQFLEGLEETGTVTSVEYGDRTRADRTGVLTATFERQLSSCPTADSTVDVSLVESTVDADGNIQCTFEPTALLTTDPGDRIDVRPTEAALESDGSLTVSFTASIQAARSTSGDPTVDATDVRGGSDAVDAHEDARVETGVRVESVDDESSSEEPESPTAQFENYDPDVPPFRNPDLLAEVYEACDTFAEMTDALGMDVTAETVRRYMVDYDIHEPNSYQTRSSDDATESAGPTNSDDAEADLTEELASPAVIADGIGLPEDVTVESLIETVKRSNTIYEVKEDIQVDRADALKMLRELNLLDLVVGRLATETERDIRREEIIDRLRTAAAR